MLPIISKSLQLFSSARLGAFQLSPLKDFKCHSVLDTESICVEKRTDSGSEAEVTANCTEPSLFVRWQNFLKNVVNLEIRERVFKAAFTLAEVLITLGIIGVVAAMTIPALVTNHRAKVMRTRLLRADAIIQQAAMRAKADEVNLDEVINQKKYEEFEIYFKNGSCKLPKDAKEAKYKNYSGSLFSAGASANTLVHSYCLFDGMILWFGKFTAFNDGVFLAIDINGWNVKPDRYGQDVFFWYYNQNTQMLIPTTTGVLSSGPNEQYNFFDKCPGNPTAEQGIACTYKAIHDESYFKKLPK